MLMRVVIAECLKLKRTLALWMVVVAPLVVVGLQFLISNHMAASVAKRADPMWPQIIQNTVGLWTLLMMPLFLTLETSLLAGLEHTDKNWKALLALPAPRWTVYAAKLLVTIALLWIAVGVLFGGTIVSGALLARLHPDSKMGAMLWAPLATPLSRIAVSALLALTIQHWVSLRWPSFVASLGFGMCVTVVGFVAVNSNEWGGLFPWSMPIHALRHATVGGVNVMVAGFGGALLVALAGGWTFSRRDVN